MKLQKLIFGIAILIVSTNTIQSQQETVVLKENWEFLKGDLGSAWEAVRPAKKGSPETVPLWEKVELPHSFNTTDAVDPNNNYYQGPGWYRKYIDIKETNGQIRLHFEGAGQKTQVYVHLNKVGKQHIGGYDEWTVNITDAVKAFKASTYKDDFDGKIPLLIRCDNSRDLEMIPSDLSDFNLYGGLYRRLNLEYKANNFINQVTVSSNLNAKRNKAYFNIKANFKTFSTVKTGHVRIKLFSPEGFLLSNTKSNISDLSKRFESNVVEIKNPKLWSPSAPNLYHYEVTLTTSEGSDLYKENIGFRDFKFLKKGPFELNGKRLLLRGTHRHEDHAGKAAAMTKEQMTQEMQLMKEMGVNFIRLGHYQQSRHILNLCDKLGIIVWEEIPWCRGGLGSDEYKEQARRMLKNMITQHKNHPSIIIWGLGNENDWPGDFTEFNKNNIRTFMSELNNLAHKLDPTRKTAIRRCDFCKEIVDVYSPSIWAGWYRGKFTDYKKVSLQEMAEVNHFLHVEWGASSHARRHSENPDKFIVNVKSETKADERDGDASLYGGDARVSKDGDWTETYACNLIDWHLKEQENMPWLTGTAYWPFKDFSTPVRPENPVPYVNQKGVIERDFTKKESYYVFQSYWTQKPMVHIYGHSWPTRWGDKNEKKLIKVYSNCPSVELIVNGKSLGSKTRNSQNYPAAGLRWEVLLNEGVNHIKAIGKKTDTIVIDQIYVDYQTTKWGKPNRLTLSLKSQTKDTIWLEAQALDAKGTKCLDAKNVVSFDIAGDGNLIVNQGTSKGSKKLQLYNGRAIIGVLHKGGRSEVSVKSKGLETGFKSIQLDPQTSAKKKDVFLLIGQSNMAGRAPFLATKKAIDGTWLFTREGQWTDLSNPLNRESSIRKKLSLQKSGLGYAFAKNLKSYYPNKEIGLVVNAKGGTSITTWNPGSHYFNEALKRVKKAKESGTLKAILWHHGVSDLNYQNYTDNLSVLIDAFRRELNMPELPFLIGGLYESNTTVNKRNQALELFATEKKHTYFVSSSKLKTFDSKHFNNLSLNEFGERYAEIVKDNVYKNTVSNTFNEQFILKKLVKKYTVLVENTKIDSTNIPRSMYKDGALIGVKSKDWTSGFFPGILWYLYDFSNENKLRIEAKKTTSFIEKEQNNGKTHDMGFKIGNSVGHGFRITQDKHYKKVLVKAAETLITRFNPTIGCIRSWDHNSDKWTFPVIIDNMMNLELLFIAYKITGDKKFYDIAVSHANTTMRNHFREDNSSYHVVDYNPTTGVATKKNTHQGLHDQSVWARGQAWGLYGYTLMYRETKNKSYLEQAKKIANLILNHPSMPKDLIPYWDYEATHLPNQPRDASAAAVTASALIELSQFVQQKLAKNYLNTGKTILANLSTEKYQEKHSKYFVLNQSTGSFPHNSEVNVPLVYADYYYVEALIRYHKLNKQ